MNEVTQILHSIDQGDAKATDQLFSLVYQELRSLAARKLSNEASGHTLQPTALVHEAWLRLSGDVKQDWRDRGHFFSAAAESMRRILIDRARSKQRIKHGGGWTRVDLEKVDIAAEADNDTLLRVNDALDKLAKEDATKAELVKLRYFAGLSVPDAGRVLGMSGSTVKRTWNYARAWLYEELTRSE